MDDNVLAHYGVRGMKWGVRRYQNEDGSLTDTGKRRYKITKTLEQRESEAQKKRDMKNRGTFTTDELKKKIERLKLEKELKDLTRSEISSGRKFIGEVMTEVGKKTLTTVLTGAALYTVKAVASGEIKNIDRKALGESIFYGGPKKK